jgi:nucleoside 2-deoxyribosyltransferase
MCPEGIEAFEYFVTYNGNRFIVTIDYDLMFDTAFWDKHKEKLQTLLYNNIWNKPRFILTRDSVEKFIDDNYFEKTPSQKMNDLLEFLNSFTKYEGEVIQFPKGLIEGELWRKLFFTNGAEAEFYVRAIQNQDLITIEETKDGIHQFSITLDGLNQIIKISESKNSRFCFVAMSFAEEMEGVYNDAIAPAIRESGFEPIRIKDEPVPSDITINDAILASIKRSKFTIADFTSNRNGVYFEAGYALGLGQKVIYSCHQADFESIHFDTNHYQYCVWETPEQLKNALIDKIEIFIKG